MKKEFISRKDFHWWQDTIVYEAYPSSFQDTNGDGLGDLQGVIRRLDYLESLGVGAIWLTPVYTSPMGDNGYDVADYYSINPRYGTMDDMDELIEKAKKHGIKIVMDLVVNHTSEECEWFKESVKNPNGDKGDWYIWADAKDGKAPNNWGGIFGDSAWTWNEDRGQYYLHTFAGFQPDLNWANPRVRKAVFDVANFWVEKGVGGFRLDAVTYIKKPEGFSDGPVDAATGFASIHNMTANTKGILDYLMEFKENVQRGRDIFTVGEANGVPAEELVEWVGENGVFDMIFEFSHMNIQFEEGEVWCKTRKWSLSELKRAFASSQKAIEKSGWYPIFLENHDFPRCINHFLPEDADPVLGAKALGMINMTLRGTPFIYQGQEIGMTNIHRNDISEYDDISTKNQYKIALENGYSKEDALECISKYSRDNARTPMQWDDKLYAGFTTKSPWLDLNENYHKINVKAQDENQDSVLNWYRRLNEFRKKYDILILGDYKEILSDSEKIFAYERKNRDERAVILVNFTGNETLYDEKVLGYGKLLLSSYKDSKKGILQPYEAACFLENKI